MRGSRALLVLVVALLLPVAVSAQGLIQFEPSSLSLKVHGSEDIKATTSLTSHYVDVDQWASTCFLRDTLKYQGVRKRAGITIIRVTALKAGTCEVGFLIGDGTGRGRPYRAKMTVTVR